MGSIKVDIHKAERQYDLISFTDIDCIKGLIKFRSTVDKFYGVSHGKVSDVTGHYNEAGVTGLIVPELICAYITLDEYLQKCNLNVKQRFIIQKLMEGNTEVDVAKMFQSDVNNIISTLNTVASRIKKINDLQWKYDYIYLNCLTASFDYKTCSRCEESKPATDDFFGRDNRNRDGLKSICKKCDAIKKNGGGNI